MIKNVEKTKHEEDKKNSPYTRLIIFFKNLISELPQENSDKYTSVTNRSSLLKLIKKKKINLIQYQNQIIMK